MAHQPTHVLGVAPLATSSLRLTDLPVELLAKICGNLCDHCMGKTKSRRGICNNNLFSLCLTSKKIGKVAQVFLYHHFKLCDFLSFWCERHHPGPDFLRAICNNSELGSFVRTCHIDDGLGPSSHHSDLSEEHAAHVLGQVTAVFREAIDYWPRPTQGIHEALKNVKISYEQWEHPGFVINISQATAIILRMMPNVKRLNMPYSSMSLLCDFPGFFRDEESLSSAVSSARFPRLQTLSLNNSYYASDSVAAPLHDSSGQSKTLRLILEFAARERSLRKLILVNPAERPISLDTCARQWMDFNPNSFAEQQSSCPSTTITSLSLLKQRHWHGHIHADPFLLRGLLVKCPDLTSFSFDSSWAQVSPDGKQTSFWTTSVRKAFQMLARHCPRTSWIRIRHHGDARVGDSRHKESWLSRDDLSPLRGLTHLQHLSISAFVSLGFCGWDCPGLRGDHSGMRDRTSLSDWSALRSYLPHSIKVIKFFCPRSEGHYFNFHGERLSLEDMNRGVNFTRRMFGNAANSGENPPPSDDLASQF